MPKHAKKHKNIWLFIPNRLTLQCNSIKNRNCKSDYRAHEVSLIVRIILKPSNL